MDDNRHTLEQLDGPLGGQVVALEIGAKPLKLSGNLLQSGLVYRPTPWSRAIFPRTPFTSVAASGDAYLFAERFDELLTRAEQRAPAETSPS